MDGGVQTTTDPGAIKVRLAHVTRGRARLRLAQRLDRDGMLALADRLGALPGAMRVLVRPNTGSVIVEANRDEAALREALEGSDAIVLLPAEKPMKVGQAAQFGILKLDYEIRHGTDDALDFRSAIGVLLLTGAAIQLARGNVAGPATTLFLSALSFFDSRSKG